MSAEIREVDEYSYPLNGSRIHKQSVLEFVAVGPEEIGRLPRRQRRAVESMVNKSHEGVRLMGFLQTDNGALHFTAGGAPIVATIDKVGNTDVIAEWL